MNKNPIEVQHLNAADVARSAVRKGDPAAGLP